MAARLFRKDRAVPTAAIIKTLVLKAKAGGIRPALTGIRKGTGGKAKADSRGTMAASGKGKIKAKAAETAGRSSKTAALRQAITAAMAGAKAKGKVSEEGTTITAAETKEVMRITGTVTIIAITAAARADAAKADHSSRRARRSTIRRRKLSSAAR